MPHAAPSTCERPIVTTREGACCLAASTLAAALQGAVVSCEDVLVEHGGRVEQFKQRNCGALDGNILYYGHP